MDLIGKTRSPKSVVRQSLFAALLRMVKKILLGSTAGWLSPLMVGFLMHLCVNNREKSRKRYH